MDTVDVRAGLTEILRGSRSFGLLRNPQTLDFKADKPTEQESYEDLAEAVVCSRNRRGAHHRRRCRPHGGGPRPFRPSMRSPNHLSSSLSRRSSTPPPVSCSSACRKAWMCTRRRMGYVDVVAETNECLPMRPAERRRRCGVQVEHSPDSSLCVAGHWSPASRREYSDGRVASALPLLTAHADARTGRGTGSGCRQDVPGDGADRTVDPKGCVEHESMTPHTRLSRWTRMRASPASSRSCRSRAQRHRHLVDRVAAV